jgi:uncharacterized protein
MRLSLNTIFVDDFPKEGQCIVYQTRTQAQVVVDRELKNILDELPTPPQKEEAREALLQLEKMGLVIDNGADEKQILEEWFEALKGDRSELKATILTTYDCNFACPYCVEEGVKAPVSMDRQTALQTVEYLRKQLETHSPEKLFVTFYGGEPLMNMAALRLLARQIGDLARKKGVPFVFGMTTNGSLLTRRVVKELAGYGLKGAKITLDGTREFHDRTRPFKTGKGSFDVILKNILDVIDLIDIDVGGNFNQANLGSFISLLDHLKSLGLAGRLHRVSFKPISPNTYSQPEGSSCSDLGCVFSDPTIMKGIIDLRRATLERGFRADPGLGINICSMVMNNLSMVIDPLGRIYRCPAFVGREGFVVGDIDHPGEEDFTSLDLWKRCIECPYVPLCGDGCIYAAYLRFGDVSRLNCQREFMEFMVRENLKLNYKFSHRET